MNIYCFSCRRLVSFPFSLFCDYKHKMNIFVYVSLFPRGRVSLRYKPTSRIMCFQVSLTVDSESPAVVYRSSDSSRSLLKSGIIGLSLFCWPDGCERHAWVWYRTHFKITSEVLFIDFLAMWQPSQGSLAPGQRYVRFAQEAAMHLNFFLFFSF